MRLGESISPISIQIATIQEGWSSDVSSLRKKALIVKLSKPPYRKLSDWILSITKLNCSKIIMKRF